MAEMRKYYKAESRKEFYRETTESLSVEEIQLGAVLRIADATEVMAKSHAKLQSDLAFYKRRVGSLVEDLDRAHRSNAALRGYIKRLKKGSSKIAQ